MVDNKISIGSSGEYYVAYTLERHGFTAAMPMANTKNFDILAINRETNKQIAVQVKTTAKNTHTWPLSSKSETLKGENIFYFFVLLHDDKGPDLYIVPSKVVADTIYKNHHEWLKTPGINGRQHKDNNIRNFSPDQMYLEAWDILR